MYIISAEKNPYNYGTFTHREFLYSRMLKRLLTALAAFKFARKYLGGTWYYLDVPYVEEGEFGNGCIWSRKKIEGFPILKIEEY